MRTLEEAVAVADAQDRDWAMVDEQYVITAPRGQLTDARIEKITLPPRAPLDEHQAHLEAHSAFLKRMEESALVREERRRRSWWRRVLLWIVDR